MSPLGNFCGSGLVEITGIVLTSRGMKTSWIKAIVASLMLGVFLTPNLLPAFHAYLDHDHDHHHYHNHKTCKAKDTDHWHNDEVECDLCDYAIGIKPIISDERELQLPLFTSTFGFIVVEEAPTGEKFLTPNLRAPPAV